MTKRFEELAEEVMAMEVGSDKAEEMLMVMQEVDEEKFLAWLDEVYTRAF